MDAVAHGVDMGEQLVSGFLVTEIVFDKGAHGQGQNILLLIVQDVQQDVHFSQHLVDGPGVFRVREEAVDSQLMEMAGGLTIIQQTGHFDGVGGL